MRGFAALTRRQRALSALESFYNKEHSPAMEDDNKDSRRTVATNAGLSSVHGGTGRRKLRYETECPEEQGLMLIVERTWDDERGTPESHIPMECPICGEEHLLPQSANLPD